MKNSVQPLIRHEKPSGGDLMKPPRVISQTNALPQFIRSQH